MLCSGETVHTSRYHRQFSLPSHTYDSRAAEVPELWIRDSLRGGGAALKLPLRTSQRHWPIFIRTRTPLPCISRQGVP